MTEDTPEERGERVVRCPVEGCTAEKLARGIHLHILRSSDAAHGEQGAYPEGVDLENLDEVGREAVDVDYPDERESESVARLCPYCKQPFKGKNGVLIHLGLVEGRKDHPEGAAAVHEPTDFPVVELDDDENIISVVSNPRVADRENTVEEAEDDDGRLSATFTQDEISYLYQTISEADVEDEGLRRLLQRKFLESLHD